jgi:hypothetical protein
MILTIAVNAILVVGVVAMVVTPLIWAIITEHRANLAATDGATTRRARGLDRRRARRAQHTPLAGRV